MDLSELIPMKDVRIRTGEVDVAAVTPSLAVAN